MAAALANGDGGLDHSALLRGVLRLSGQDPDSKPTTDSPS
jgi:2-hydroxy-3-oxopropionate reductase